MVDQRILLETGEVLGGCLGDAFAHRVEDRGFGDLAEEGFRGGPPVAGHVEVEGFGQLIGMALRPAGLIGRFEAGRGQEGVDSG